MNKIFMTQTFADQKRKTVETAEFTEDGRFCSPHWSFERISEKHDE